MTLLDTIVASTTITPREIFLGIVALAGVIANLYTTFSNKKKVTVDIKAIETEILTRLQNLYGKMIDDLNEEVTKLKNKVTSMEEEKSYVVSSRRKIIRVVRNSNCKSDCPVKSAVEKILEKEEE